MSEADRVDGGEHDRAEPERFQTIRGSDKEEQNWVFVGNDEEGAPIYLDINRMVRPSGSGPTRLWLKGVPSQGTPSFDQARQYLKEAGKDYRVFHHIEQLLHFDVNQNLVADLALFFCDHNGHVIEEVQFRESTFRPSGAEAVYSTIKGVVAGRDVQPRAEREPDSTESTIDEKIHLKLQEINSAFEAFDRSDGADMGGQKKPAKS